MPSNASRPVIGLTAYLEPARFGVWDTESAVLHREYVDATVAACGVPVLLPPIGVPDLAGIVDGLVLTGGADVDPARYGASPHGTTVSRPGRDAFEFALLDAAMAAGVPVLGVCRGMQVLNVALGGTLTQHLPEVTGTADHQPATATFGKCEVRLAEGSRAAAILGAHTTAHCYHHQAIATLGPELRAAGWAEDGTVEAVERPGDQFVLGVQWHPEQQSDDVRLFAALVAAARRHREERA
ncbi:putative glutamine amidotransferase [Actinokineospora alba]|uniref:Putative glutamine amidotransferase n=1 Tax=Actinokineospora alba TaxID=504798 RepID=A0A1H0QUS6_9PSEU|nr:gamma-glutamyl-gamma-aminobutyrate hydrolase family protein [Actinokineospora alba]TDP70384.1 putative glutamine amidotransferase [Actinokineospora alba]SDI32851.1 putative glutamine amidotransferase [Actinokineospora alba]SDP21044.1 putative glutamine amidotransferase [Actinokineospora alba]